MLIIENILNLSSDISKVNEVSKRVIKRELENKVKKFINDYIKIINRNTSNILSLKLISSVLNGDEIKFTIKSSVATLEFNLNILSLTEEKLLTFEKEIYKSIFEKYPILKIKENGQYKFAKIVKIKDNSIKYIVCEDEKNDFKLKEYKGTREEINYLKNDILTHKIYNKIIELIN